MSPQLATMAPAESTMAAAPRLAHRRGLSMVAAMHRLAFCATLGVVVLLALPAQSQTKTPPAQPAAKQPAATVPAAPRPQKLGTAQSWTAYSAPEKGGQICYVVGEPAKSEPVGAKRDPVHLLVTHNTGD